MDFPAIRFKDDIEKVYALILAPYAAAIPEKNSREHDEPVQVDDLRSSFQRDRDRIIHSKAFRRLMYKTQVFVNHEGDHFRTRLTHTLEVSQFARGIAKSLALNEDLAEAIALGHDLGHTPFGHAVEQFFDEQLKSLGMGRFYHNEQSVRIVDFLEDRDSNNRGLNLTKEVREGILKHNDDSSGIYTNLDPKLPCSTLEGQVVSLVDTIAYVCHDLEDGIKSGLLQRNINRNPDDRISFTELRDMIIEVTKGDICIDCDFYKETYFVRKLIHYFISNLTQDSYEKIKNFKVMSLEDVKNLSKQGIRIIGFHDSTKEIFKKIRKFVYRNLYDTQTIVMMDTKAVKVIKDMFEAFVDNKKLLPPECLYRYNHIYTDPLYKGSANNEVRVIIDYLSCMTDRYALDEHERIFNPRIKL
ncbi:MAG: dNTP triphosphohydrolase [Clostridia bacterium]|nr:dNTP triphosphohydrolase [Clostridia bacterium]